MYEKEVKLINQKPIATIGSAGLETQLCGQATTVSAMMGGSIIDTAVK